MQGILQVYLTPVKSAYYCRSTWKLTGTNYSELSSTQNYHHIKTVITAGPHQKLLRNCQGRRKLWGRLSQVNKPCVSPWGSLRSERQREGKYTNSLLRQLCCSWQNPLQGMSNSDAATASSHTSLLIVKILQDSPPSTLLQRFVYTYISVTWFFHTATFPSNHTSKAFVSSILVFVTWEVSIPTSTSNCWPGTYVSS